MGRERILVTVKTYPTLSRKYGETVCTAGVREDGSWEADDRDWDPDKLEQMRRKGNQGELFSEEAWRETFRVIPKLPYKFSYEFEDSEGKRPKLQILDWEIGALYWNCWRRAGRDEVEALEKVRIKYVDQFLKSDLHFFMGTTQQWHSVSLNPWVIIGVFPIPHEHQMSLI